MGCGGSGKPVSSDLALVLASVSTVITAVVGGIVTVQVAKLNLQAKAAEVKADTSKVETDAKLHSLGEVAQATHALVNSAMREALLANALLARKYADLTGNTGDLTTAETAERVLAEHDVAQRVADADNAIPPPR